MINVVTPSDSEETTQEPTPDEHAKSIFVGLVTIGCGVGLLGAFAMWVAFWAALAVTVYENTYNWTHGSGGIGVQQAGHPDSDRLTE